MNALFSRYGIAAALVFVICLFSALRPDAFPTMANAGSIMSDNAVLTIVALGVMVPLVIGQFDLSPGFVASLAVMLTAGLLSRQELSWPIVMLIVLGVGVMIGAIMGTLVAYLQLNSLIVSLGMGSILGGLVLFYSNGQIIFQGIPAGFLTLGQTRIGGIIPLPFLYAIVLASIMWFILYMRPVGRRLYAIGGGPEAAKLIGIDVNRYIVGSFVISATLASLAGFIQVARLGAGHPTSAQAFLLPAFAAAFLGATCFRPGFYNVWGTVLAVYLVGTGTTGLFMLGAESYVQPIFNGGILITAVAAARMGALRKADRMRRQAAAASATNQNSAPAAEAGQRTFATS
ncbi:ABC transporter permease [Sphingobium olei]|uniref:ABC transporter permease n=1 Tax=Sphingobium olei TaxID=420955 RepID=A0ABW3P158_9SPHN